VRTTNLDARNFYDPDGTKKSPRNLKQFGATVGGPIVKEKLFFLALTKTTLYRRNVGQIVTPATVGLASPSTGSDCAFTSVAGGDCTNSAIDAIADVHAAFLAGQIPNDVSAASLNIAGCTIGPPISCNGTGIPLNGGTNPAGNTVIDYGLPNSVRVDNGLGKSTIN